MLESTRASPHLSNLSAYRVAAKEEAAEEGKKKKGGISIPDEWPWEEAKKIFQNPDVTPADELELEWKNPDIDGLIQFLVTEKGFNEERVRKGAEKLSKHLNAKQQGRLDGFFSVQPKTSPKKTDGKGKGKSKDDGKSAKGTKRKAKDDEKQAGSSKKGKTKK